MNGCSEDIKIQEKKLKTTSPPPPNIRLNKTVVIATKGVFM